MKLGVKNRSMNYVTRGEYVIKTNEQYIKTSDRCPSCDSYEVTTIDHVEIDSNSASQKVKCDSCKATWQDIYQLIGYEIGEVI